MEYALVSIVSLFIGYGLCRLEIGGVFETLIGGFNEKRISARNVVIAENEATAMLHDVDASDRRRVVSSNDLDISRNEVRTVLNMEAVDHIRVGETFEVDEVLADELRDDSAIVKQESRD